ncbi:DUF2829 domain-containing protein [Xenorhabdus sp. DI]|uniref:Thoeris anti-defense Tad2 family protein n=1 Tax=Xenorhabdus doucetiae TaxID=351671 RepID=UPI0019B8288A|nr:MULTISPECIES: MW1434 family type I TA system toxin [unclassified Xenorhabdus]MBD2786607.1 DUF2829 domain-containing protein [Xenorhabdus sp. 3]MBD2790454.1 DUF2829 domain-containing protein [Xenorhabdus sp. DI]
MSEINKPYPLNPDQYKSDDVAPIGSFPWAMIQLYLGKKVHRKDWDVPNEYIQLRPASEGLPALIEQFDKHGSFTIWTPTQEDLIACDWNLLKAEDNKPEPKCPFNLDQYNLVPPVGSLPWTLIQVYLGNKAHRNDWDGPKEYIHLVQQVEASGGGEEVAHIELLDKHGNFAPWTPTQEDLLACDWNLLGSEPKPKPKPDGNKIIFDIKIGYTQRDDSGYDYGHVYGYWGYSSSNIPNIDDEENDRLPVSPPAPIGSLKIISNETSFITKILSFYWISGNLNPLPSIYSLSREVNVLNNLS